MTQPQPETDAVETKAERRAIVREMARQLDKHDAEHIGPWGKPDEDGCVWCW